MATDGILTAECNVPMYCRDRRQSPNCIRKNVNAAFNGVSNKLWLTLHMEVWFLMTYVKKIIIKIFGNCQSSSCWELAIVIELHPDFSDQIIAFLFNTAFSKYFTGVLVNVLIICDRIKKFIHMNIFFTVPKMHPMYRRRHDQFKHLHKHFFITEQIYNITFAVW